MKCIVSQHIGMALMSQDQGGKTLMPSLSRHSELLSKSRIHVKVFNVFKIVNKCKEKKNN